MQSLLETLQQQLSPDLLRSLGERVGMDEETTQRAVASALPMILAGLNRNAQSPDGAQQLQQVLEQDHDGSILGQMGDFFSRGDTREGQSIVGHIFGESQPAVEQGVSNILGLGKGSSALLLALLAPVVMGMIGKKQREESLGADGLTGMLEKNTQYAHQQAPDLMSSLTRVLDSNNDGSVVDDLLRMGQGVLGGLLRGR